MAIITGRDSVESGVVRYSTSGFNELAKYLKEMPERLQKQVIAEALKKEAIKIRDEIRSTSKYTDRTKKVDRSIKVRANRQFRQYGEIGFRIFSNYYITRFQEYGWYIKDKDGNIKKDVKEKGFFADAFNKNKDFVIEEFSKKTIDFILNDMKRMPKLRAKYG